MAPLGSVFPPRSADEIEAYDDDELFAGFIEYKADDPFPATIELPLTDGVGRMGTGIELAKTVMTR